VVEEITRRGAQRRVRVVIKPSDKHSKACGSGSRSE
jgi:hypothetical protein